MSRGRWSVRGRRRHVDEQEGCDEWAVPVRPEPSLVRPNAELKVEVRSAWLSAYVSMKQIADPLSIYSHGHDAAGFPWERCNRVRNPVSSQHPSFVSIAAGLHCCPESITDTWMSCTTAVGDLFLYYNKPRAPCLFWLSATFHFLLPWILTCTTWCGLICH